MTILLLAGLIPLGSITVNAAANIYGATASTDIANSNAEFPYILVIEDNTDNPKFIRIFLSQTPWHVGDLYYNSTKTGTAFATGNLNPNTADDTYGILDVALSVNGNLIVAADTSLYYSNNGIIQSASVIKLGQTYGITNRYTTPFFITKGYINSSASVSNFNVWTNSEWTAAEQSAVNSFSNNLEDIGITSGLTELQVQQIINQSINATTSATSSAQTYQQQALNNYQQYQNGTISLATLESRLNNIITQLNALNSSASATLADKVAINNALTQTQILNDTAIKDAIIEEMEEDLTTTSNIFSSIATQVSQANRTFQNFTQGAVTQSEAVTQINENILNLTLLITPQTPIADVEAINTAVNTIKSIKHSITNYSELDQNVSENQISSDQEEIEMLNELVSVMQDQTIEDKMQDQQIAGKANTINNILDPVWDNKFFTYLIGTSSVLILACILLHVRYRML